jgi:hypothetical protein
MGRKPNGQYSSSSKFRQAITIIAALLDRVPPKFEIILDDILLG